MDELEEMFQQISGRVTWEEFLERVEEKIALMGGLCDRMTAAMLVSRELGAEDMTVKIHSIKPESGAVNFVGRVISISEVRQFQRSDGSQGRVATLSLGDETGTIKVIIWDQATELIGSGDLTVGQVLKVRGYSREGRTGVEISMGRNCTFQEVDQEVTPRIQPLKIAEIGQEMGEVNIMARVLDPGEVREFQRRDGTAGKLRSVLLGDETGRIRLTLWNDQAQVELSPGDGLRIINAYARERYGQLELSAVGSTVVQLEDVPVNYVERFTDIADLAVGSVCSIAGYVTGIGEVREFTRQDGRSAQVGNIHISDETGRVKVALWGDHVRLLEGVDLGSRAEIRDAQVKSGWNEELEVSCGWRTQVTFTPP